MEKNNLLEKIIDEWLSNKSDNNAIKDCAKESLINQITEEIKSNITPELKKEIYAKTKEQLEEEYKRKSLRDIISILIQTVILGFITGLLVNQVTELISYIKCGAVINLTATCWISGVLFIITVVWVIYIMLQEIIPLFEKISK